MPKKLKPVISSWYQSEAGDQFEVVALDADEENVEIQYMDGTLAELDMEAWNSLRVEEIEAPQDAFSELYEDEEESGDYRGVNEIDEDWSDSFDDLE